MMQTIWALWCSFLWLYDPGRIIAISGSILVIWCVLNLFNPYLRRVEDREWIEAQT